jgi:hypothetical protein
MSGVHLSGTLESPQQDLSPRLVNALKDSPGALLGAAFRALDAWTHPKLSLVTGHLSLFWLGLPLRSSSQLLNFRGEISSHNRN